MKLKFYFFYVWLLSLIYMNLDCLIIPDEVSSVWSYLTSNLPTIKLGTDSKFGFGFDFGRFANYQTVFEIGPQKEADTNTESDEQNDVKDVENTINERIDLPRIKDQFSASNGGKWMKSFKLNFLKSNQKI